MTAIFHFLNPFAKEENSNDIRFTMIQMKSSDIQKVRNRRQAAKDRPKKVILGLATAV